MSQVRVRSASCAHVISTNLPSRLSLQLTASVDHSIPPKEVDCLFPSLPPLLRGHPDIHLRNGVMNASRMADAGQLDSERAFFVVDLSRVFHQHQRWITNLPEVHPFYAVKCNPDPYVLRLLASLGTGFDCASHGEISEVLKLGVEPSRIIFANPCKSTSFIQHAGAAAVHMMTFDNVDELHKISRANPRAKLVIRILTDDSKSLCVLGIKFGAPLSTVPDLLAEARKLGLDVIGVSFHVGSGCYEPGQAYAEAIMRARAVFDMGIAAGYKFTLLDIGGGFEDSTFEIAAGSLKRAFDQYFPDRRKLKIIAEPGRFYVSTAFSLAANIIARRAPCPRAIAPPQDAPPKIMYYINEGVYGAFNCILFDHQVVHPYVLSMADSFHIPATEPVGDCSVWGPTCDSIDCVSPTTQLPTALRVGDWLAFKNMGAYTVCAASRFNGFAPSKIIYTSGGMGGADLRRALATWNGP